MGKFEFTLPAMGEGIIEATITRWFFNEGDQLEKDEPLLEVATDKVDSEVPAPVSGMLSRIIYHEGEIPKIGEVLALIENEDIPEKDNVKLSSSDRYKPGAFKPVTKQKQKQKVQIYRNSDDKILTPFIRFLARDRGIGMEELRNIKGSGIGGRITKPDLNAYISAGREFRDYKQAIASDEEENTLQAGSGEEIIEMSRTRRLIADHMVQSKRTSPHVTSMVEVDVTRLVQWRESNKDRFFEKTSTKLTYTSLIIEAVVKALKQFPDMNISVSGNHIIRKKYINIGVATALPNGDLIVPVIKDADNRNLSNIATVLSDLAHRARESKLQPSEVKGGTFTITNMGQYDNISGTPIINQPQVGILAVGAIKKKPAVVTIKGQQSIGIRDILILSLTYDHRVVDGTLGGSFVKTIGENLVEDLPDF